MPRARREYVPTDEAKCRHAACSLGTATAQKAAMFPMEASWTKRAPTASGDVMPTGRDVVVVDRGSVVLVAMALQALSAKEVIAMVVSPRAAYRVNAICRSSLSERPA